MSTRSRIAAATDDGKVRSIYCHSDGYLSHNGRLLIEHYQTDEAIAALMELGSLSFLSVSPAAPPPNHTFENGAPGFCVAYGRDRGEVETEARPHESLEAAALFFLGEQGEEYNYLWSGLHWLVWSDHWKTPGPHLLTDALETPPEAAD